VPLSQETEQDKKAEDSVGMGDKTSRREKALDGSELRVGNCYKNTEDSQYPHEYQGKLLKRSKNENGSWRLVFEGSNEYVGVPPEIKGFVKCACRKVFTERLTTQTRKREKLQKEMTACAKEKCSAEQAADEKYTRQYNKTVKQRCKGLKGVGIIGSDWVGSDWVGSDWVGSDWDKCRQAIYKKQKGWTKDRNLYDCRTEKCKKIGNAIKKTYYTD
jgi:hypothetical protein